MIIVMGHIFVASSDQHEFLTDIEVIVPLTREEEGCLFYNVTLDDAQAGRVAVAERWQDEAALAAHLHGPQVKAFEKWVGRMRIEVFQYELRTNGPSWLRTLCSSKAAVSGRNQSFSQR